MPTRRTLGYPFASCPYLSQPGAAMPIDVTALLRTALRRLESERDRLDRQVGALKTAFDGANAPPKASRQRPSVVKGMTMRSIKCNL